MTIRQGGKERVYLAYTATSLFILERSQNRNSSKGENLEGGVETQSMKGALTGLLPMAWFSLLS